jgi:hypothetical protein
VVNVKSNFKSFIKGEGIRILRNTSNEIEFHKRIKLFTEKLKVRGYNIQMIKNILSEPHCNPSKLIFSFSSNAIPSAILSGKQTAKTASRGSLVSFRNQFQFVENK